MKHLTAIAIAALALLAVSAFAPQGDFPRGDLPGFIAGKNHVLMHLEYAGQLDGPRSNQVRPDLIPTWRKLLDLADCEPALEEDGTPSAPREYLMVSHIQGRWLTLVPTVVGDIRHKNGTPFKFGIKTSTVRVDYPNIDVESFRHGTRTINLDHVISIHGYVVSEFDPAYHSQSQKK